MLIDFEFDIRCEAVVLPNQFYKCPMAVAAFLILAFIILTSRDNMPEMVDQMNLNVSSIESAVQSIVIEEASQGPAP